MCPLTEDYFKRRHREEAVAHLEEFLVNVASETSVIIIFRFFTVSTRK